MMRLKAHSISILTAILSLGSVIVAQIPADPGGMPLPEEDNTWWYVMIFVLFATLAVAVGWWYKTKNSGSGNTGGAEGDDSDSLDADFELAWLKSVSKKKGQSKNGDKYPNGLPRTSRVLRKNDISTLSEIDEKSFDETRQKLQKIQFDKLPINSFDGLRPPKVFDALPISSDVALMSAIEQTQCEDEEDPEIRELAVRILARFKNRNSVEALSQTAMYDISSNIRSKAVGVLAEFDHESVFETLLLCCADPTREVRAAAARALFTVTFDRADAWARIAESNDEYRMVQAARAAIESDLVDRSIERLIHEDIKQAYEAFALIALMVRAGETMEIFQILESHANQFIKLALIRVFKVIQDDRALPMLYSYMERNSLPEVLSKAVNDCIKSSNLVPA